MSSESLKLSETCEGYNLSAPKPNCPNGDQKVCGWDCTKCINATGNHWKCEKRPVPVDCTPGKKATNCASCENYIFCGYSGNTETGRCSRMNSAEDLSPTQPANCYNYSEGITTGKSAHGGEDKTCYWNIIPTCGSGVSCTTGDPGPCKTWTAKTDSRGSKVYCGVVNTCGGSTSCTTGNPGNCYTWTANTDSKGNTVYCNAKKLSSATDLNASSPGSCYNYSAGQGTNGVRCYWNKNKIAPNTDLTSDKPASCRTYQTGAGTNGTTCYYAITLLSNSSDLTSVAPADGAIFSSAVGSDGVRCYYGISNTSVEDCTTTKPGACKTYSTNTDGFGTTYYCGISTTGAADCQTSKPSVTDSNCNKFSTTTDTNGNTVYYNISKPSKPSVSQTCTPSGTTCSGTQTRTPTCMSDGSGWSEPGFGECSYTAPSCPSGTYADTSNTDYNYTLNTTLCNKTKCYNRTLKGCSDYNNQYLDASSCTNVACSASNPTKVVCTAVTPRTGLTCYTKSTTQCNCSEGGYYDSSQNYTCEANPTGYKNTTSTSLTYGSKTCYTAGAKTQCNCSEGGYQTESLNHNCTASPVGYKRTNSTSVVYGGNTCYLTGNDVQCSCSEGGYYDSSQNYTCVANPTGYKNTTSTNLTYGGKTCYTAGSKTQCSCSEGGYHDSNQNYSCAANPTGYKNTTSTAQTYGGKTCYTAGSKTQCSCSEGGYVDSCVNSCTSNSSATICSGVTYGGLSCYAQSSGSCASGQFCRITSYNQNIVCSSTNSESYYNTDAFSNLSGVCENVGSVNTYTGPIAVSYGSGFNFWSAKNWCAAQGKRMISYEVASRFYDRLRSDMYPGAVSLSWTDRSSASPGLGDYTCYAYGMYFEYPDSPFMSSGRTFNGASALCVAKDGCLINADCPSGQYCRITTMNQVNTCSMSEPNTYANLAGVCESIGSVGTATINGISVTYKTTGLNYWSARNWCEANGKRLFTESEANSSFSTIKSAVYPQLSCSRAWTSTSCSANLGDYSCSGSDMYFTYGYQMCSGRYDNGSCPVCR